MAEQGIDAGRAVSISNQHKDPVTGLFLEGKGRTFRDRAEARIDAVIDIEAHQNGAVVIRPGSKAFENVMTEHAFGEAVLAITPGRQVVLDLKDYPYPNDEMRSLVVRQITFAARSGKTLGLANVSSKVRRSLESQNLLEDNKDVGTNVKVFDSVSDAVLELGGVEVKAGALSVEQLKKIAVAASLKKEAERRPIVTRVNNNIEGPVSKVTSNTGLGGVVSVEITRSDLPKRSNAPELLRDEVSAAIGEAQSSGAVKVEVDLAKVAFISRSSVAALATLASRSRELGIEIKVKNLANDSVSRQIGRLGQSLTVAA